ncbi:MAG: tetratricopeptide repeat protein [Armatimonadetes bacterium]|nr:tetratricopeptide repeat protein [Armatimonadota bacterium]
MLILWFIASLTSAQPPAFIPVDEMEGDVSARWRDVGGSAKPTLEPDEAIVQEGETSGRWDLDAAAQVVYLAGPELPSNFEELGALQMWVHSAKPTGAVFAVVLHSENPETDGEDYYRCLVPVDWEGWRLLHLEPRSFAVARQPVGWRRIDSLRFAAAGWSDLKQAPGTVLRFDALRLVKGLATPERRPLFEPDTDWCAWWPLPYGTTPAKTGRYVSDWYPREDGPSVVNRSVPRDWSGSVRLNLWLYSEETPGVVLRVHAGSDREETPEPDGYDAEMALDWVGWKLASLPLTDFRRVGEPAGWHAIDELRLTAALPESAPDAARLCLDDMWLSATEGAGEAAVAGAGGTGDTPPGGVAPTVVAPGQGAGEPPTSPARVVDSTQLLREALEAKRKGDLELAFTKYIAVLLREPESVEAHWGLAWVLASKGEKEAAIEHFSQVAALSKDPARVKEARDAVARLKR